MSTPGHKPGSHPPEKASTYLALTLAPAAKALALASSSCLAAAPSALQVLAHPFASSVPSQQSAWQQGQVCGRLQRLQECLKSSV